ncbi:MAG TPA: DinB family protein [Actinomycetota bacterium]|nr:DinB family protein [Actinomycetota bacterium]
MRDEFDGGRASARYDAAEKEALADTLDFHRATIKWKLEGLSLEDAARPMTPSETKLLGIVKHLAYVEVWWFQDNFLGRDCKYPWDETGDMEDDFRIFPGETIESIVALYDEKCEESRRIVAAASLDDRAARLRRETGYPNLRWIMLHMIEEVARHNGQADILRVLLDGTTGA